MATVFAAVARAPLTAILIVFEVTGANDYGLVLPLMLSAAFATFWGAGALAGSLIGGGAMEAFGPQGLPLSLAACFGVFLAGMWLRRVQRMRQDRVGGG